MLLPAPLTDEIFGSLLARMCRMNGYADFRDMVSTYCSNGTISSFIDAEIDISRFCRQTDDAYLGADEILHTLTWYGLQVKLGEMAGQRIDGLAEGSVRLNLGASMFTDSAVLGYCPSCREHDYQHYGMTYWHRLHQLPIVFFCPIHGDRVVKVRVKRYTLHKEFPVPGDFESASNISEPMSGMNESFWRGVADMASEALHEDVLPEAELMFSVLAAELRRKKFVSPLSGVRLSAFIEELATKAFENSYDTLSLKTVVFLRGIARSLDKPEAGVVFGRVVM